MPSKRDSSDRVDYVPALCTHRPSLLPIGCAGEMLGLAVDGGSPHSATENFIKPSHLEEGEVVTRFPLTAITSGKEAALKRRPLVDARVGDILKVPESPVTPLVPAAAVKTAARHLGESRGHGNNPAARDNGQPSASVLHRQRVQFTD